MSKTVAQLAVAPDANRRVHACRVLYFMASRFAPVNRRNVGRQELALLAVQFSAMAWSDVVPELTRLHRFIDLAVSGLQFGMEATRSVEQHRRVTEVLRRPDPYGTEDTYQTALAKAAELESFAKEQAAAKFSYAHELGIVKLWSILENAIDELTLERLRDPQGRGSDALNSFEGPLLPFLNASPDEQSEFLLGKLKSSLKAPLQRGVGRFEALLNPIRLGGSVEPLAARALIDLSETRNVIVHRGGVADKQYLSRCPWNQTPLGDKVQVKKRQFDWHACAADWYVVEVDARLEHSRGGARPSSHDELQIELVGSLRQLNPAP